ncbi:phage major capsid protein [Ligilactobacillus murinus]|uniref:phage major capsid protein n=1 Tax=Ligilactobacillus murinus TaxID=1622 RepID=UPI00129831AE|nr:phage major capsid protein [Ligilactobacillus murinus]
MNINELNDAWIASGQKVSDMDAKLSALVMDDSFDETKFKDLKAKRDNEALRRDAIKDQLEIERMASKVMQTPDKKLTPKEENLKDEFVNNFIGMIKGDPKVVNMVTSSVDENGDQAGLTIPTDIQTTIHTLVRQYDALEQYVNHESVTTPSGSRVYEKWSDITPLANLDDESATIGDNDDPKLMVIKYLIKRYAGITTVTNTLLKDTAENILAWLSTWIARKVVVTRNKAIIDVMSKAPKKTTLAKFDDIVTMINTSVDPAIKTTSFLMTNTAGLNVLSQVKDAMGRYLLQPDPKQPDQYLLKGKRIIEVADRWLPDMGNAHPLYYGDLKQAVTLFDRENMSLLATNIGAGAFEKDLYKIRVIDRFDVVSTDSEAWVAGSFTTIADQPANLSAEETKG